MPTSGCEDAAGGYPLTFMQREIWFQCQFPANAALHRVGVAATISGELDRARFAEALQTVIDRQAVMRTSFRRCGDGPRQFVSPHLPAEFEFADLSAENLPSLGDFAQRARVCDQFARLAGTPFDLAAAPLWRAALMRVAEREHWLFFIYHHLIVDGYHASALVGEIGATYWRLTRGDEAPAAPIAVAYHDFAAQFDARHRAGAFDEHGAYWLDQLRAPVADAIIPRDRVPPLARRFENDGLWRRMDGELAAALAPLGRTCRSTPFRLLFATFAIFLGRLSGAREVLIATPFSTRPPELQAVAGLFASSLPVRIVLDPAQPFRQFAAAVSRTLDEARRRREYPIVEAFRRLQEDGHRHSTAAVRVGMSQVAHIDLQLPDFRLEQRPSMFTSAQHYDLWLGVKELTSGISLTFGYAIELFERDTIERFLVYFETMLADALRDPDRPIGDLNLMPAADRLTIVESWSREAPAAASEAVRLDPSSSPVLAPVDAWGTSIDGARFLEDATDAPADAIGPLDARRAPDAAGARISRPVGSSVYVLDANLCAVPIKVPGEICIGGSGLALGYRDRPDLTAARFVPHPFVAGERLFRTGMPGRWLPDGSLELRDRHERRPVLADPAAREGAALVEPRTELERQLADVWADVLGTRVGITADYFEAGGDSLAWIRIVARARAAGMPLKERDLLEHRTVEALAACCQSRAIPSAASTSPALDRLVTPDVDEDELAALLGEGGAA